MDEIQSNASHETPTTDNEQPIVTPPDAPVPRRNKKVLWIATAVVVVLLIIVVWLILPAKTSAPSSNNSTNSTNTSAQAKTTSIPGEPAVCGDEFDLCVPNVDRTRDVVPKLQAAGYTCANDAVATDTFACTNNNSQAIKFSNDGSPVSDTHISAVSIEASTKAVGSNPPDQSGQTWTLNNDTFHKAVSAIFASYPKVQQDLNAWLSKQDGSCAYKSVSDHDTVDGYQLSCQQATPIAVGGNGLTVTSWTSIINLVTPSADD